MVEYHARRVTPCSSKHRDERGAAAVEFALIIGLLLTILFAIVGFGRAYSERVALTGAAREGARCAAVRAETCDVEEVIADAAGAYEVNGVISAGTCDVETVGEPVTVSWTQEFTVNALVKTFEWAREIRAVFRCE